MLLYYWFIIISIVLVFTFSGYSQHYSGPQKVVFGLILGVISGLLSIREFNKDLPRLRIGVNEEGEEYFYLISEEEQKKEGC